MRDLRRPSHHSHPAGDGDDEPLVDPGRSLGLRPLALLGAFSFLLIGLSSLVPLLWPPRPRPCPISAMTRSSESPEPHHQPTEVLVGSIERVTFHNPSNGFCVLRIKARGHRDLVTVVGHAAEISAGEWVTVSGTWVTSREHGQQFKAAFLRTSATTTAEGIERHVGSVMSPGPA